MSENREELSRIVNKTFGELLSDGFSLFWYNWVKIIIPFALFYILSLLLREIILVDLQWNLALLEASVAPLLELDPSLITQEDLQLMMNYLGSSLGLAILDLILANIFTILALCSVASFLYKTYSNQGADIWKEFKGAFNKKLLPVIILLGLVIPLGIFTLFIVSIIIFGFYIFSIFTYQIKDVDKPITRARSYSKGNFWRIIGTLFISALITFFLNMIYSFILVFIWPEVTVNLISWYNPASRRLDLLIINRLINNIVPILIEPLFICLLTPIFASKRFRDQLSREIVRQPSPYRTMEPLKQPEFSDKGIYCPFCGTHMEFKLNFCPNCGEQLNFELGVK